MVVVLAVVAVMEVRVRVRVVVVVVGVVVVHMTGGYIPGRKSPGEQPVWCKTLPKLVQIV